MTRLLFLLVLCVPLAAVAAPVPPEAADRDRLIKLFGIPSDPDKDCRFNLIGEKLRITIPGTNHSMAPIPGRWNAPRTGRALAGDFTAVVRVRFVNTPGPTGDACPAGYAKAGLIAWAGNESVQVCRDEYEKPGAGLDRESFTRTRSVPPEGWIQYLPGDPKNRSVTAFLRMRRAGQNVTGGWSRDGKKWAEFQPIEVNWGDRVRVGVLAENGATISFAAESEQLTITQPKK